LKVPEGEITEAGLRLNIDVGIQYMAAWLKGNGAVPIYNLMEDAATAEISRSQVWQWVRHGAKLNDGRTITVDLVRDLVALETEKLRDKPGIALASQLFESMIAKPQFTEFLTLVGYDYIA